MNSIDFLNFLNRLEITLNDIEVKGYANQNKMVGCFVAITQMKQALMSMKDGEENGGQVDTGTNSGTDNTDK